MHHVAGAGIGDWRMGVRHGHGRLREAGGEEYLGAWAAGLQHGYGVHEDPRAAQKYLGAWVEGLRHGPGVVVHAGGLYFEGLFAHNRLQGRALLLTEDELCFDGEFASDRQLHGKGTLTLGGMGRLEGFFVGAWDDGGGGAAASTGLKVNGVYHRPRAGGAGAGAAAGPAGEDADAAPDSRGAVAARTDRFRPRRLDAAHKWAAVFERCRQQLLDEEAAAGARPQTGGGGGNRLGVDGAPASVGAMRA